MNPGASGPAKVGTAAASQSETKVPMRQNGLGTVTAPTGPGSSPDWKDEGNVIDHGPVVKSA